MNHWLLNSQRNLLPLSISTDFSEALKEWEFTGSIHDKEEWDEEELVCELCLHPDLNSQYEILNKNTDKKLWIGNSCILKFADIRVLDRNNHLLNNEEDRRKELVRRHSEYCNELAVRPLRELWKKCEIEDRIYVEISGKEIKKGTPVSPLTLANIFKDLEGFDLAYKPKLYKVSLQSFTDKLEIKRMDDELWKLLYPALTASQRQSALKKRMPNGNL